MNILNLDIETAVADNLVRSFVSSEWIYADELNRLSVSTEPELDLCRENVIIKNSSFGCVVIHHVTAFEVVTNQYDS